MRPVVVPGATIGRIEIRPAPAARLGGDAVTHQTVEKVQLGTWVKVSGFVPGVDTVLRFVPDREVDYRQFKVPTRGPLAEALLGAKVGDKPVLTLRGRKIPLTVLEVGSDAADDRPPPPHGALPRR
jgi:transcription elongation GreA/GreB family factor